MALMEVPHLILASASPRRAELLRSAAVPFTVDVADIAEDVKSGESPVQHAERLAREKAEVVAKRNPGKIVLGADTRGGPHQRQRGDTLQRVLHAQQSHGRQ